MAHPSHAAARRFWEQVRPRLDDGPQPEEPTLVVMAGVPLVGKTTLARHLVEDLEAATLHVENDRLRALVLEAMGRAEPVFDEAEDHATYEAARWLIERGLEQGLHVVHDATNLRTEARRRTYELADELQGPVRVVFVHAPDPVLQQRARREGPAAQRALEALGEHRPHPGEHARPHVVLDGTREPAANVRELLEEDAFASLGASASP